MITSPLFTSQLSSSQLSSSQLSSSHSSTSHSQKVVLTAAQQLAVHFPSLPEHLNKHLVLEAGAGAGKTQVLSLRVHWLVHSAPALLRLPPFRIYLVTFSRSADKELRERVEKQFASSAEQMGGQVHVSTIDSLFMKLCESKHAAWWEQAMHLPCTKTLRPASTTPPHLELVSEDIVVRQMEQELVTLLKTYVADPAVAALTFDFILSGAFRGGTSQQGVYHSGYGPTARLDILKAMLSETFLALDNRPVVLAAKKIHPLAPQLINALQELARTHFYRRILRGQFTHSDKTMFLYNLYCVPTENRVGTPFEAQENATFPIAPAELIVDEYQDTNDIQHEILYRLATSGGGRMVVVGDPKQSIYGFRNARVEVFNRLKKDDRWIHIQLLANFRSDSGLLSEINTLSELTFQYRNPKIPEAFWQSSLAQSAIQSYVAPLALDAGKIESLDQLDSPPALSIVGASLNTDRCSDSFSLEKGFELPEFQLWTLVRHVKEAGQHLTEKEHNSKPWSQIAILCESNARVAKVVETLTQFSIPALALSAGSLAAQEATHVLAHRIGLTLTRLLLGPVSCLELYELLISPLVALPLSTVETFLWHIRNTELATAFAWLIHTPQQQTLKTVNHVKDVNFSSTPNVLTSDNLAKLTAEFPELMPFLQVFIDHKKTAAQNFFAGWQTLRWRLAISLVPPSQISSAKYFCAQLDTFASALAALLDSPSVRRQAEECAARISVFPSASPPLPDSLLHWKLNSLPQGQINAGFDTVKVMTIHAAKGLEWPWVFFVPNASRDMPVEDFKLLASQRGRSLKWMQTDLESLSVVARISNPYFTEDDSISVAGARATSPVKVFWHADLQAKVEKEFERQRIFYTAFTRARNHLVILYPAASRRTRKNLRDKLGEVKNTEGQALAKAKITSLEETVLARYLDDRFELRKPEARSSKPPEPWFEQPPTAHFRASFPLGHANNARSLDYGPAWYPVFCSEWQHSLVATSTLGTKQINSLEQGIKQVEKSIDDQENNIEDQLNAESAILGPTSLPPVEWPLLVPKPLHTAPELSSLVPLVVPQVPSSSSRLARRERAAAGVQYHAAQENAPEKAAIHPGTLLKKASRKVFEEMEVWSVIKTAAATTTNLNRPDRHILDLVCRMTVADFPPALLPYTANLDCPTPQTLIERFSNCTLNTPLWVVLDYKTGQVNSKDTEQLRNYLELVERIAISQNKVSPPPENLVIGVLCYDFKFARQQGASLESLSLSVNSQVFSNQYGLVFCVPT